MTFRASALHKVGNHTVDMRGVVWRVRRELDGLQKSTDALQDIATEPLILSGPFLRSVVLQQLSEGCQALRDRFLGPVTGLHISG